MLTKIRYSMLRFFHFVDAEDQELGTLEDIVIDAKSLQPVAILLGGGFFEEFLESKGELDDIDELAPISSIKKIEDDYIILADKLEEMQTTFKNGKLPIDGYKLTDLMNKPVYDKSRDLEGKLFDLEFDDLQSRFLITFPTLLYQMSSEGYNQRFDISIPQYLIKVTSEDIVLQKTKNELIEIIRSDIKAKSKGRSLLVIDS